MLDPEGVQNLFVLLTLDVVTSVERAQNQRFQVRFRGTRILLFTCGPADLVRDSAGPEMATLPRENVVGE